MAYNNYYPYYNPYQNQVNIGQQQTGIIWVQGEAGAKSYLIAPGQSVPLLDSESQTIYIKSADASGMPSIKVLDYTIRQEPVQKAQNGPVTAFATKEEVDTIRQDLLVLRANYEAMKSKGESNES